MRIVGADGKEELAKINQPAGLAMEGEAGPMQNDMTVDAYDVVFEMGPSYNSQREEAREGMLAFLQASPELAPAMLDLVAKMQDWPLADEVAERLEIMLPARSRPRWLPRTASRRRRRARKSRCRLRPCSARRSSRTRSTSSR
jgi:hypothetical protein